MQEMIAYTAVAIIAAVLLLTLALVSWRGQQGSIDAAQYEAATQGALDFVQFLDRDLANLGAGLSDAYVANSGAVITFDSTKPTTPTPNTLVEFWTQATAAQVTAWDSVRVRYQWALTGTAQVLNPTTGTYDIAPTYIVERFEWNCSDSPCPSTPNWQPRGQSVGTLTEFDLTFFDIVGDTLENPMASNAVREVRVAFRVVSPLGGGSSSVPGRKATLSTSTKRGGTESSIQSISREDSEFIELPE